MSLTIHFFSEEENIDPEPVTFTSVKLPESPENYDVIDVGVSCTLIYVTTSATINDCLLGPSSNSEPEQEVVVKQCTALTKDKSPCSRQASGDDGLCTQHRKQKISK